MNYLEDLIKQYERETGENAKLGYGREFVEWLASRPTCGIEQRKFLDEIKKNETSFYKQSVTPHHSGITIGVATFIDEMDFECDLHKVIKGE